MRTTCIIDMIIYEEYGKWSKDGEKDMETYKYEGVWRVRENKKNETNIHNRHPNHSF